MNPAHGLETTYTALGVGRGALAVNVKDARVLVSNKINRSKVCAVTPKKLGQFYRNFFPEWKIHFGVFFLVRKE